MNDDTGDTGFNDAGEIEPVTQFPYEQVGKDTDDGPDKLTPAELDEMRRELSELSQEEIDAALKMFRCLMRWVWQDAQKNANGLLIRSVIACWIFLEDVQQFSLTAIAYKFDRDKQSPGRWMPSFKKAFPMIKTPHMQLEQTKKKGKHDG